MRRDELWQALDAIAADEAPSVPAIDSLAAGAARRRRRRLARRLGASMLGVLITVSALLGMARLGDSGTPARPPLTAPSGPVAGPTSPGTPSASSPVTPPASRPTGPPVGATGPPAPSLAPLTPESVADSTPARPRSVRVDIGGGGAGPFTADPNLGGDFTADFPDRPVSADGVPRAAPLRVYQSCHVGAAFVYKITKLPPGARYVLRLHWAELAFEGPGERVFSVAVDGRTVLPRVDVVAETGARGRALVHEFPVTVGREGFVTATFSRAGADDPFLCALEALPSS